MDRPLRCIQCPQCNLPKPKTKKVSSGLTILKNGVRACHECCIQDVECSECKGIGARCQMVVWDTKPEEVKNGPLVCHMCRAKADYWRGMCNILFTSCQLCDMTPGVFDKIWTKTKFGTICNGCFLLHMKCDGCKGTFGDNVFSLKDGRYLCEPCDLENFNSWMEQKS